VFSVEGLGFEFLSFTVQTRNALALAMTLTLKGVGGAECGINARCMTCD
jgi:hypothetical protein